MKNYKESLERVRVVLLGIDCPDYPAITESLAISRLTGYLDTAFDAGVETFPLYDRSYNYDPQKTAEAIYKLKPDLLGISIKHGSYSVFEKVFSALEKLYKNEEMPMIVVGNIIPTLYGKELLKGKYKNIIIGRYEGEHILKGLVNYLLGKCKLESVPNIVYYQGRKIVETRFHMIPDLAEIGPARYSFLDQHILDGTLILLEESRGCPWGKCRFCNRLFKGYRAFSPEQIVNEIRIIAERWGELRRMYKHNEEFYKRRSLYLSFVSENTLTEHTLKRASEISEKIIRLRNKLIREKILPKNAQFDFYIAMRVSSISRSTKKHGGFKTGINTLKKLVEAGVGKISIGIESGSRTQLKRYNKGTGVDEAEKVLEILLNDFDVTIEPGFIMFDPLATIEEIKDNIDFIERTKIIDLIPRFTHELEVYHGTSMLPLIRKAEKKHGIKILGELEMNTLRYPTINFLNKEVGKIRDLAVAHNEVYRDLFYLLKSISHEVNERSESTESWVCDAIDCYHTMKRSEFEYMKSLVDLQMGDGFTRNRLRIVRAKTLGTIGESVARMVYNIQAGKEKENSISTRIRLLREGNKAIKEISKSI